MKRFLFLLSACILIFSSCENEEKPVTNSEALALKDLIDSCIRTNRPGEFNKLISAKLLAQNIEKRQKKNLGASFVKQITSALNNAAMGQQILNSIKDDGFYELVKRYEKDGSQHLVYRLYANSSLNYHDFELGRSNGKVYIGDIFIYVSGQDLSESISELADNIGDDTPQNASDVIAMQKIKQLLMDEKYQEAKDVYDRLPTQLREQRALLIMNILICSGLDEEIYTKSIEKFSRMFPNEPNMFLMMIDACILKKDFNGALDYVNKTDSVINKDPFLDYYRGLLYKQKGETANATLYFEKVVKSMPYFNDGVLGLIEEYLIEEKNEKAREAIALYKKNKKTNNGMLQLLLLSYPDFKE